MHCNIQSITEYAVAPYVGAWIETLMSQRLPLLRKVAPYVGAWIETFVEVLAALVELSHPMWVRGLKLSCGVDIPHARSRTLCGCVD